MAAGSQIRLTFSTLRTADWSIWTAATTTRSDVRDQIISGVVKYAADGNNDLPLADWYDTLSGTQADLYDNYARPVVGGHLALVNLLMI